MGLFGDVTHSLAIDHGIAAGGISFEEDLAGGGLDQAGHDPHRGRFARAIRTEVSGDLAWARDEAYIGDRRDAGVRAYSRLRSQALRLSSSGFNR